METKIWRATGSGGEEEGEGGPKPAWCTCKHACVPMSSSTLQLRSQNATKLYAPQLTNNTVIIHVNIHSNMVLSKDLTSL